MIDFHSFETFDPNGPGLGNLFGQVSPFEALGIWPSGDFRLAPGDGAVPAIGYYLGAAFALALLLHGLVRCWRRRETAIVSGLAAAAVAYTAARVGGTPYTAAKAIEIAAPLAALAILLPLLRPDPGEGRRFRGTALAGPVAAVFVLTATGCSLLALANAPDRPDLLHAGAHRAAPARRLRLDRRARLRHAPRRTARCLLHRLGAARRPCLHRAPKAKLGISRRRECALSSPRARPPSRPSPACACAASPFPTCSGNERRRSAAAAPAR